MRQTAQDWEKQAAVTRQFDRAIEYLKVPEVSHTSNKWVKAKDEFDYNRISNKVYKMSYRIYERSSYRTDAKNMTSDGIFTQTGRNRKTRIRWQVKSVFVIPVRKPRNTYRAELRRIRICLRKYRRLSRKNTKNPLWYTANYCRVTPRRPCKRQRKRKKRRKIPQSEKSLLR